VIPLPITHYPLPITHYPLPITHYPLPITHYPLPSLIFAVLLHQKLNDKNDIGLSYSKPHEDPHVERYAVGGYRWRFRENIFFFSKIGIIFYTREKLLCEEQGSAGGGL
jgi:hypothetical protein